MKIVERNINDLRDADDTILLAESNNDLEWLDESKKVLKQDYT